MRVLVIGGTGFIGPYVVERLIGMNHEVALFHRGRTEARLPDDVLHVHGDRENLTSFGAEFERFGPDVVLDMFPYSEKDAREAVGALRGVAGRIVAISSGDVYRAYGRLIGTEPGPPDPVPLDEDAPLRERLYPYRKEEPGATEDLKLRADDYEKILVERTVMGDPQLRGTVLRLPVVYGPRDDQHRLFPYLKRMDDGRTTLLLEEGMDRWRWTKGYVENVAAAVALAVADERAAGRTYNVGEAETLTEAAWVAAIGEAADWHGGVVAVPRDRLPGHLATGLDTNQHLVIDTSRLRTELGYKEIVPRDEALRRTISWERDHPREEVNREEFDYAAEDAALAEPG